MAYTTNKKGQRRKMIVSKFYPVSDGTSQEKWDSIFPGNKEFEEKYGKIVKYHLSFKDGNKIERVEYVTDGKITTKEFITRISGDIPKQ